MNRRTYTVTETARILGISRSSAYEAVRRGELPSITIGHRILIARATIDELLGDAATSRHDDGMSAA
jgi:excisionase family DNA binding protein